MKLKVKVQCTDWIDIDRVQVLVNGPPRKDLNFTRQSHPDWFSNGVVKFDRTLEVKLSEDAHLIVVAIGETLIHEVGHYFGMSEEEMALDAMTDVSAFGTMLVYKGKAEHYVDFLAAYRGRMKAFGGFNYRVQLNVRNLTEDGRLQRINAYPEKWFEGTITYVYPTLKPETRTVPVTISPTRASMTPSLASRSAFLAARARPFSRSRAASTARSHSPWIGGKAWRLRKHWAG